MSRSQMNERLVERIRAGDEMAWGELAYENRGFVFFFVGRAMEKCDLEGDARLQRRDELLERAYEGLCEGCANITRAKTSISGYLAKAIKNRMFRDDPSLVKWLPKDLDVFQGNGEIDNKPDGGIESADAFFKRRDRQDVLLLLNWIILGDDINTAIVAMRMQDVPVAEIAEELGITPPKVYQRLLGIRVKFYKLRAGRMLYDSRGTNSRRIQRQHGRPDP